MAGSLKIQDLERFLDKIPQANILVIGDLILDQFVMGQVKRISPEAPVPVVEVKKEIYRCGGAGNVCFNIKGLGGNVSIIGIIGDDANGEILKNMLEESKISNFLIERKNFPTSIKTRVIASSQQMIRVDKERIEKLSQEELHRIQDFLSQNIKDFDGVIISDYGKGVIVSSLISYIVGLCRKNKKIITVDPKINHFLYYKNVDCMTPNLMEASAGMHLPEPSSVEEIESLGKKIMKKLCLQSLVITRGKDGMSVFKDSDVFHQQAMSKEVFDVTGAGDTVIAILTLALACGFDILKASIFANIAAGVVVQKIGTANVSAEELRQAFNGYQRISG